MLEICVGSCEFYYILGIFLSESKGKFRYYSYKYYRREHFAFPRELLVGCFAGIRYSVDLQGRDCKIKCQMKFKGNKNSEMKILTDRKLRNLRATLGQLSYTRRRVQEPCRQHDRDNRRSWSLQQPKIPGKVASQLDPRGNLFE